MGQVHRRPEVVAVARQHGAQGQTHSHIGQEVVVGVRIAQVQADARRIGCIVDDEHDLVTDHLHHPAAGRGDDVVGNLLETSDDRGQLLVAEMLAEQGEPNHVGKPDRQDGALTRRQAVAAQHHAPLNPCRHLTPPDELEELGHRWDGDVGHAGEGVARQHRVDLGTDHVAGHQLRLGDPRHRGADDPGHLHGRLDVGGADGLQALKEAHGFEVEVGEGPFVVFDAREPEGAPESLELVEADTGQLGDVDPGIAPA